MEVYHLTVTSNFEAQDYSSAEIFDMLHQSGEIFLSLESAQARAQTYAYTLSENDPQSVNWVNDTPAMWRGLYPEKEDEEWCATIHLVQVSD